jgi:hypothetical protein
MLGTRRAAIHPFVVEPGFDGIGSWRRMKKAPGGGPRGGNSRRRKAVDQSKFIVKRTPP